MILKFIVVEDDRTELQDCSGKMGTFESMDISGIFSDIDTALRYARENREECTVLIWKRSGADEMECVHPGISILIKKQEKRIQIRTFGGFDLFIDGKAVPFTNSKAKELLALCVDHRGGMVSMDEAVRKLWENRTCDSKVKNLYRKAVMYLKHSFDDMDAGNFFHTVRGACCIYASCADCDYFSFLEGQQDAVMEWTLKKSYLPEYKWAQETEISIAAQWKSRSSEDG